MLIKLLFIKILNVNIQKSHHCIDRLDVGYVPVGGFHYAQNIGDETLQFLEVFNSDHFTDISLAQWLAMTPREVVKSVLNLPDDFLNNLHKESNPVVKYKNFEFPYAQNTQQNVCYFKDFNFKAPADPDNKTIQSELLPAFGIIIYS